MQRKIANVVAPVIAMPIGKARGDIGHPIEVDIVQYNQFVIARRDDILFKIIRSHCVREGFGG